MLAYSATKGKLQLYDDEYYKTLTPIPIPDFAIINVLALKTPLLVTVDTVCDV